MSAAYESLLAYHRTTCALQQISGLADWDQETHMPKGGAGQRAEQQSAITAVIHRRMSSLVLGELLNAVDQNALDEIGRANVRILRLEHRRTVAVPVELAAAIARATSLAIGVWQQAKEQEDVSLFLPNLTEIVALKREEASALPGGAESLYDNLLLKYEPQTNSAWLDRIFGRLRSRLVSLRDRILESGVCPPQLNCDFPADRQMRLAHSIASAFGYDWNCGRLDISAHPFTSGQGKDVRITTRIDESNPYNCLYSTIHEAGHGVYEQRIAPEFAFMPAGSGASFGVHESQSRFCENQIARCRAYSGWLFRRLRSEFGDIGIGDESSFFANVNQVERGHIRTEADEVQYNLHIMLRYALERDLIFGNLEVRDLEQAWNSRFAADFGYPVDKPSNGMLQDIHWAAGLFGYFPTYTLGNIYGGCLHDRLRRDLPDLDESLAAGDPTPAMDWMRRKIQRHGSVYEPMDIIRRATGGEVSEGQLIAYLESKFAEIYGL